MTTESSSTQTNSGTQSVSGFSQSPFGRLGDAVGTENLPGFPGGGGQNGGTQSGGEGGNSFAGGGAPISPFDQIRYNIDQAIYNAFPPGGGTPDANTSIDTSSLNPFNQPPGGASQPSTDGGSQVAGPEGASFGGYNPFDPSFGSNVNNQAIQASQGGGFGGSQGGGFGGSQGGGFGGGDSNQAGSPFASNPQANQIDATRADLTNSVTAQVNSGNVDSDAIETEIGSAVNAIVTSSTGSTPSLTDAGISESIPTEDSVSDTTNAIAESVFVEQPLSEYTDNAEAQITTNTNSDLAPVSEVLEASSTNDFDAFLNNVSPEQIASFADLIGQYGDSTESDDLTKVTNFLNSVAASTGWESNDSPLITDGSSSLETSNFEELLSTGIGNNVSPTGQSIFNELQGNISYYRDIFQPIVGTNESGSNSTIV
ncbi:hypothetical protein NUACC21_33360 [Scytonema sp. NUACC21]